MKRITLLVLALSLFVPTLFAAEGPAFAAAGEFRRPIDLPATNKTFADALAELRSARGGGLMRIEPNVVLEGSEAAFVIPVAGSGAGNGGTFFRSEGIIVNRSNRAQNVEYYYFPMGGGAANCSRPAVRKQLAANSWYLYTDLVSELFNTSGFGAIIVLGVTSNFAVDTTARIDGNSRIWTPQPGTANGTTSQNFPSMSLQMPAGTQSIFGLRLDEFYRSNVGIFNYDTNQRTFDITVSGFRGNNQFTMTVDACSLVQTSLPGGPYGSFLLSIGARDGRGAYFTYASSVDNVTGDAWSVTGRSF